MAEDIQGQLYKQLSEKYDFGDETAFRNALRSKDGAKYIYDTATQGGYDLGDYNSFENSLGFNKPAARKVEKVVQPKEQTQTERPVAVESPQTQTSGGKRAVVPVVEIGTPTVEVEDNGVKKSPEAFLAGTEAPQQTRPKGIPDYTKAPSYPSVNESWAYTKTASIIDYNNPLEKGAMQASRYGVMLTTDEANAIRNNTNWDDLARQSKALQEKYRGGVDTSSTQYMHDAQLLAEIHNRMVNIELGVNGSVSKGERQYRLYADEMRRKGKYFSFYDGLLQNGADLRHWNPFMDLTDKVMARREADKKAGKNYPDNYYYHMALKDGEFRQKVHEYALALAKQTGMEWGEAKTWAAGHSDRFDEQFKEKKAKEFAESPWYSVISALMDNSVADVVKTLYNTYDLIKGQPLRTEGVNDLLQRSMKYAGEGKNVIRGVLSFIPEAVTLMPVTGVAATRAVGALSKVFTFTPRAMKIATGGLSFMGYEMAKTALGAISRGEDINWAEMAGNSAKGFILGGGGALISEGVAGIAPRVNSTAANYAIQGAGKVAEAGQFASVEMAMAYLGNDKETTWTSSLLNNGALIISMAIGYGIGHGFGFKSRISTDTIEKVRKAGYNTLANEMAKHTQAVERGAMPKGYSQAAISEMQVMQQNMGSNGLSWSDYAEVLKPTNTIMTKPGTNSIEKVKDGKGYRIVSYDVNGVEIERSKVYDEAAIDKKFAKRQREVEKKREEANVKSFDIMRESTINAKAARAVADALNQEDGKSVYNTDGTVNEAFDGITADDILNAYEVLNEKPAAQLSESEARLVSMFKQQAEQIGAGLLDSQGVKRTICERYGISEEAFDAAWKADAKDRKGKEAEACAAYNTAISRDYSVTAGIETARGAVDGAEATIKSRIETNAEGLPLDPNQKVYYELADGVTRVTTAEHVIIEPQAEDPGVLGDRIANDNLTKLINEKTEEVRANFAEVPTEDLEDSLNALRNAIKYEGDEDGSKRLLSIALTKEIESRRAAESDTMRVEWNGMTHGEKVQHFVDKKFSGRTQEEREELTRYYTEHPSEFDDVLSYDGTHSAEISALVDSMGFTDSKEWDNKYKEYKEDEESFRKDFKKKFGVEPTERPYGFEQKESEIATPRSTDEPPIELNENGTVVGGDATQEPPIELDGEGKVVNTEQGTAPVAESSLVDVVGIPEEYREDWQRYWEQNPPKDAIDILLDRMDVMDETQRSEMRKSYEENPEFFQKEWDEWNSGISIADVERALGLEPTVREEVRADEVQEQKEPTPTNEPVAEKPAVESINAPTEAPKPENEMQPVKVEGTEEETVPPAAETDNATEERNRKIDELLDFMGIEGEEREGYREGYISNPEALDEDYNDYLAEKLKEETEEAPKDEEPPKEEPTTEGSAEPRIVDNLDEAMPMLDDGEPNVELATPRRTRHYLYEESGLEAKDATDKVDYEIKKAKDAAKKAEKGEPKMSDKGIDGNIGKLKKAKQEWNDKKAAADAKLEYWNEVKRQQGLYDLIDEIGETKTPKSMADLIVKLKSRFKNDAEISSALNSYTVEPRNMYEACMLYLGSGVRFVWDSEGARKGLKQELGYGDEERSKMVGLLSKDGITVQRAVHDIVDQYGADLGFDLSRSQEVYDTLIDALSSVSTRGDVFAFINERRLNAVEDILRKRLGNGDVQSRDESEADIRANEEFEALKEQYKDELPENPTEDDVLNLMERKRQESEAVNVDGERQAEDTLPNETGVNDDFFEGGEDEYVPFRDGEESEREMRRDSEESKKLFDATKKKFGTTNDFREAGYILPDGTMLDFSGRYMVDEGKDTSHLSGRRAVDHRAIHEVGYDKDENETGFSTNMQDFVGRGAIRIDSNAGTINLSMAPTKEQARVLQQLIARNGGDVTVDFGDGYNNEHYAEYESARATRVLGDIDRYFNEGIKPEGNLRYRQQEPMGERGVKKVTVVSEPEYREGTDYFGRPMMHRVKPGQYKVEGYDDIFNSVEEVADFMRKKNPDYCVYIDEDGNIGYEAWSNILPEGVKPNTYAKILATNGGKLSSAMKKRIERYTQREMKQARTRAEEITKELGLDVEFHDDPSEFSGRKSRAKGWYDPKTGKIHVVMGNHSGVGDVVATMLHEGVAHHGLRKLFGEDFDTFLDNVHNNVSEDIRADINSRIEKMRASDQEGAHSDDYYRRAATEEYLADLAEDGLYNGEQNTGYASRAWQYIKESFINLLRKAGINIELTDDELRYILWSSHKNLRRGAEAMAEDAVMREKAGIKDYVEDGEPVNNVAESGRQMSLFPEGNMRSLGGAREMRDAELLEEIGKDRYDVRSVYTDEYDRRHNREYNESYDSTTKMLEDDNTSIKQVEEMLIDAAYYLRNNYTSKERAVAMARFDAIQEYYFNKEAELEKARDDFFAKHEEELKERFGDYYDEEANIDKLMSEYGIVREPRVPYGAVSEAREILRGTDDRFRDGEEEQQSDLATRLRERMRQRMERARGANGGEEPRTESGSSGGIIPPVESPTPSAPATPEPAPELPSTDYDRPMSPIEQAQAAAIKAVADTKASLEQRNAARRELTASLRNIHKAMGLQKEYDRTTVENVVNLCKMMVQSGLIDHSYVSNLTPLFTKLKDATGKQDLTSTVNDIMDVMLKSQERSVRNEIAKLLNTKGTKVDQNGVVTQAGLDIRGQHTMKELSEYMGKGSVIIDNHISKLEEARARIPDGHQERIDDIDDKILGSQLAKQFSEIEETHSVNIREAEEDLNFLKERYKAGEIGVKEYTEQKHALENLIRSYRMAQADALWNQVNALNYVIAGSKEGTRNWIEQQKQHKSEILHNAYSDMEGASKQTQGDPTMTQKVVNMSVPKFFSSSLYTLQTMLKSLGNKHALGEGHLYNRFFRGWMEQRDAEITEYRDDMNELNSKAKELTGHSYFGIYDMIQKLPKMTVEYMDGGEMLPHELDQGQLGYAYMVNKMEDGAAALRNMGITEEKMEEISNFLDPKLKEFYDWLQDDFLAGKWDGMNEVHKRMFGADMDRVANYIPLRRDREAGKQKVDISQESEPPLQSTVVGSIIQRVHSNLGIDLKHSNAIDVVANHLLEATHWKHFSEWKRDSNTLLSDTKFRNKVKNSTTIYGSGKILWERLNQVFQIAGGDYKPSAKASSVDKAIVDMARTVNTAKVSMRVFTATKQLLSLPVFATECNPAILLKNVAFLLSPVKTSGNPAQNSFVWCMQNLPQFRERWVSRIAGETRLENGDLGWGYSRQKVLEAAGRIGLTPNAFIDACTVAAGAKSIYEKRYKQYKKDGYSEEVADKKAKIDAEVAFNESQQSSEKAFVSPIQVDRTAVALGLSTFRNASMGYERKLVDAIRNFRHLTDHKDTVEFMKKQMERDGLTETQAKDAAERLYRRALWRSTLNFLMFGFGAQMAWNVGGKLPYLIFGDDDEEKKKIYKQAAVHAGIGGWIEGMPAGDMLSEGMTNWAMNLIDNGNPLEGTSFFEFDPDLLTVTSDAVKVTKYLEGKNPLKGATAFVNLLGQIYTGVNPETFSDAGVAIYDACNGDPEVGNEALMCILRIMQCPQSQLDQMYIDELKMSARQAQNLTPEEVARRYAYYKAHKDTPYMWWMYNQSKKDEIVKKYEGDFTKKLNKDVKEAGGTPEDYHDLMESATTEKKTKEYRSKEIDALSAQGAEALIKAWEKERDKGASADYKYMKALMTRYQKDVYGKGKTPDDADEAELYQETHGEDIKEQALKIGRDLGFGAQDSYFQMSQYKAQHTSAKDPAMKKLSDNNGGFRYSEKGKFFDINDYQIKKPVKDAAKRANVEKVVKENRELLKRNYRNGWRMARIKALYKDIEAEIAEGKEGFERDKVKKNFEEILYILEDERRDAAKWERTHPKVKFTKKIETY